MAPHRLCSVYWSSVYCVYLHTDNHHSSHYLIAIKSVGIGLILLQFDNIPAIKSFPSQFSCSDKKAFNATC